MAHRHTSDTPASPTCDDLPRTVPEGGSTTPTWGAGPGAAHLYVHLPFCAHRCGYCDFVTVTGHDGDHGGYVDALLGELELERGLLADEVETVFLGGGTPTLVPDNDLHLSPPAREVNRVRPPIEAIVWAPFDLHANDPVRARQPEPQTQ